MHKSNRQNTRPESKSDEALDQAVVDRQQNKNLAFSETQPSVITETNYEHPTLQAERKMVSNEKAVLSLDKKVVTPLATDIPSHHQKLQQTQQDPQKEDRVINQHSLISKNPVDVAFPFSRGGSGSLPRSLFPVLDRNSSSNALSNEQFEALAQINGKVLCRNPTTKHFKWFTPSLLQSSAHLYANHASAQLLNIRDNSALPPLTDEDYLRLHKNRFTPAFHELLSTAIILHPMTLSPSDKCFSSMRQQWFKTVRIVCDSYSYFTCDDKQCFNSPLCPASSAQYTFCGIKPAYMMKSNTANTVASIKSTERPWKSWCLSQDTVQSSIYDQYCLNSLCKATNPNPLHLFLRHDYRSERYCHNNTIVRLVDLINWVKSKYLVSIISTSKNKALVNRIQAFIKGNFLQWTDLCPHYNHQQSQAADGKTCPTTTNNTLQPSHHIDNQSLECLEKQLKKKYNTNKTIYALNSLSPIDRWLTATWCAQQSCILNNPNHVDSCWDIRRRKEEFANDIKSGSKSNIASMFTTAEQAWNTARRHHQNIVKRLNMNLISAHCLKNTSAPVFNYFSAPSFVHHLQQFVKNKQLVRNIFTPSSMYKLHPLPDIVAGYVEYRNITRHINLIHEVRAQKRLKNALQAKPMNEQQLQDHLYSYDKHERKCSKLITPRTLSQAKSKLRTLYLNAKSPQHWFEYQSMLNANLGHVTTYTNPTGERTIGDSIANFFSRIKRKIVE